MIKLAFQIDNDWKPVIISKTSMLICPCVLLVPLSHPGRLLLVASRQEIEADHGTAAQHELVHALIQARNSMVRLKYGCTYLPKEELSFKLPSTR